MEPVAINESLANRTILVAASEVHEIVSELMNRGARVVNWPKTEVIGPESFAALDEAIENLFGYDWLVFANLNALVFFLRRLQHLGHEISESDALRVCALDDATRQQLEESSVHVDLVPETLATEGVMAALETYVGGKDALRGLNLLLPRAAISRDPLPQALEAAGARVDWVAAYRTVPNNTELVQLSVLLEGGGIDCVAFTNPAIVSELAEVFDTNDLSRLLKEVVVACADRATAEAATDFGLRVEITHSELTISSLALAIANHFPP